MSGMHRAARARIKTVVALSILVFFSMRDVVSADYEPPMLIKAARVVVAPGEIIEGGRVLIENGRVTDVGPSIEAPAHAVIFDASELTLYSGLIDGLSHRGISPSTRSADEVKRLADISPDTKEDVQSRTVEAYRWLVHPSWRAEERLDPEKAELAKSRKGGFTTAHIASPSSILSGTSAIFSLSDGPRRRQIAKSDVAMHAAFVTRPSAEDGPRSGPRSYPTSTMGAVALMRQTFLDAGWHRDLIAWSQRNPQGERTPLDRDLEALWPALDGTQRVAFLANGENEIHRALNIAAEFRLKPMIIGGREAWRVVERLKQEQVPVILSAKWSEAPTPPKGPMRAVEKSTTQAAEEEVADTTSAWSDRGPMFDDAWHDRAWISRREFEEKRRLWGEEVDNALRLHEAGISFAFATFDLDDATEIHERLREAIRRGLPADVALGSLTKASADILGIADSAGRVARGVLANLTLATGPLFEKETKIRWTIIEGKAFRIEGKSEGRDDKPGAHKKPDAEDSDAASAPDSADRNLIGTNDAAVAASASESTSSGAGASTSDEEDSDEALLTKRNKIEWPEYFCEIEADRKPRIETDGDVMLRNATLLTIEAGDLANTDLLIRDGKIAEIGEGMPARKGVMEIDLSGYCVTPGLIDPHSHICIRGGVNEGTMSATPEVRIRDVINHRDLSAWRALAGGTTCIHTMHGSANTIGGQNAVLRLKYGRPESEWHFREAPRTVKFALGENVKRSNGSGRRSRFPATRMGVEAVLRRSLDAAVSYIEAQEAFKRDTTARKDPRPVRRDLRLEALADVYHGDIWVHCHCYRADEVLRLLTVAEDYGFRIGVLQHILEGYRVIPEILRHGCSTSTFSDWWAYKIEAFNAIPHNAARLAQSGVVSTVNSDSAEVIRHLNLEAAKSLRFGGLTPNDALRLVTLNCAIQLGIDKQVGSLKVGKFADIAVFDGHPLDTYSRCVLTLIDGEAYFQHPDFDVASPPTPREIKTFADLQEPAELELGTSEETWLINARIHPISGAVIANGHVAILDGRISAIGEGEGMPSDEANVIDLGGLNVYPGLINAGVPIGLLEIESVAGTDDQVVLGSFQSDLHALSAYDPFSVMVRVARSEGVLAALVSPRGGAVAGQGGVVRLNGWSMPEARLRDGIGLFVKIPYLSDDAPWWMSEKRKKERREKYPEQLAAFEDFFRRAAEYCRAVDMHEPVEKNRRLEAMRPFLAAEAPIFFQAGSVKQIAEALKFAEKHGLRPVIFGGKEAWKMADELAAKHVDVVVVRSMAMPGSAYEPFDSIYRNATVLADAGVRFAFATQEPSLAKQLGIEAGMAVAHGLDEDRALRAITLDAARILGVDDMLGSLAPGKSADLIITTDSPMQASNCVVAAFIDGRPIDLDNKHSQQDRQWLLRPAPDLAPAPELRGPPPMHLSD